MTRPRHLQVGASTFAGLGAALALVVPEFMRERAIRLSMASRSRPPLTDGTTLLILSVCSAVAVALVAVLLMSYLRPIVLRVAASLVLPFALGIPAAIPVYKYAYRSVPEAIHVSIPNEHLWVGPLAVATALLVFWLMQSPTTLQRIPTHRPEA